MKIDEHITRKIKNARKGFALTGAGISAPSGIPTFRGPNGFWKDKDPFSPKSFRENPQLVWHWHEEMREMMRKATPNPAHYALTEIQNSFDDFAIITQNIDNLHQEAGSKNVIELHGNIYRNKCNECGKKFGEIQSEEIPKCDECGGLIRPDVVWYGEIIPLHALQKARELVEDCEICLIIGTSGMVQPAASLPLLARENGAYTLEINKEETVITSYLDDSLFGDVSEILPELSKTLL
ncbi:MAG: NAD-dependent deacylase [candidate division WOR-3 bacterium]|nr:NAD-dependent deacylase [candidate division WOR-3 bacterium]